MSKYDATGQAHAKHAPEGSERERILQEKRVLWKLTKERDAALAQVEIERQRAEKAVAEAAMERKRSGKAERLSAATAAGARGSLRTRAGRRARRSRRPRRRSSRWPWP